MTCQVYILEIQSLVTQGSRPGRTIGGSVDGSVEVDCSDWSNWDQYQISDTRPNTEFKLKEKSTRLHIQLDTDL